MTKRCKKCGSADLYKDGRCKPCAKARAAKYYVDNADKAKARSAKSREENPEKIKLYQDSYRLQNPELTKKFREKNPDYAHKWRANNIDKAKDTEAKSRHKHREKRNAYNKTWCAENHEKIIESAHIRAKLNPEKDRIKSQKRHAAKLNAIPSWFGELDELIMIEAADLCVRREKTTGIKWHMDHTVPLRNKLVCGLHIGCNIAVITAKANTTKGNRYWSDMP
jgi:hypothetical protein